MGTDPLARVSTRKTPQNKRADPRQVPNSAGGFSFELSDVDRLRRFLILGTDGGSYYASEQDLTRENAEVVLRLAQTDPITLVDEVVAISEGGRAPRQNPALFALAVAASSESVEGRRYALDALPRVARIGTHLFQFITYVEQFRGWGKTLKRAVGNWYLNRNVDDLAYQAVKYRQRNGVAQADVLRLAHPKTTDVEYRALFNWIVNRNVDVSRAPLDPETKKVLERPVGATASDLPPLIAAFESAQRATHASEVIPLIREFRLPWEALPDHLLNNADVWDALLDAGLPMHALMRQLPRLTNLGLVTPLGGWTQRVVDRLTNAEALRRSRVHPLQVLVAHRTYAAGTGHQRSSTTWTPSRPIVDALDAAFYAAFGSIEPTGKRLMLALDVSASMSMGLIARSPLTPREASAAMALVTANVESAYEIVGFTALGSRRRTTDTALSRLSISPRQRLDDAVRAVSNLPFGGTDCALPMLDALNRRLEIDTFVIYTDNETWAGYVHPHQALMQYRDQSGINAKLIVVGMMSNGFSIANPSDPGMLDVVGFDTATPTLISDFTRGFSQEVH